jgi:gluconolactonase
MFKIFINILLISLLISLLICSCKKEDANDVLAGESLMIADNLLFAEGPVYHNNHLYFSDIQANKIYRWDESNGLSVFIENSGGANGLFFDAFGNLVVCEGSNKRISLFDVDRNEVLVADSFENSPFNEPNDLWISPNGNIYFTDPVFSGTLTQPCEDVYCILSSNHQIIKVAGDLLRPNGIIGNYSGTNLFIADYGASEIFRYTISEDATLTNKEPFADIQADGLTIDGEDNLYAAGQSIMIFDPEGSLTASMEVSGTPTNLYYTEKDNVRFLFVTTHHSVVRITL